MGKPRSHWDVVVVGTGFGGSMAALPLARAGRSVLLLDRGGGVARNASVDWNTRAMLIDRVYQSDVGYEAPHKRGRGMNYPNATLGGNSVIYGAASFRLRESDFRRRSHFAGTDPLADRYVDWPITYDDLAPYYDDAERLLGVVGTSGVDPCEPRHPGYSAPPPRYSQPAQIVANAAAKLNLHPFPIPLAINFHGNDGRSPCIQCTKCDMFPCPIGAKNDLTVTVLPEVQRLGAEIRGHTDVIRLRREGGRISEVDCVDTCTGEPFTVGCDVAIVAGGAIGSARLLLASGLDAIEPNGPLVGRHLMRHCTGIMISVLPFPANPNGVFHKQVAITDFYHGHPNGKNPAGPWGMVQSLQVPPTRFLETAPLPIRRFAVRSQPRQIYLICIAEDLPNAANRVTLHRTRRDPRGYPIANVDHVYHERDLAARAGLYREARQILRTAGARMWKRMDVHTFSHALGTCRFGTDPTEAVLDPHCRFFGIPNLYVVDGSFLPTSAGVNPSLTIAANGLRVGRHLAEAWPGPT